MSFHPSQDPSGAFVPASQCIVCGKRPAPLKLPFAVGREDSPPLPKKRRLFGVVPLRKKFVQRHRWVWHCLPLCQDCGGDHRSDGIWRAVQAHPATRRLVAQGYTETRIDPGFQGREEEITFTEEPV